MIEILLGFYLFYIMCLLIIGSRPTPPVDGESRMIRRVGGAHELAV